MDSLQRIKMGILDVLLPKFKASIQDAKSDVNMENTFDYLANFIENTVSALWEPSTLPKHVDSHVTKIANEIMNVYRVIEPTLVNNYVNNIPSPFFAVSAKTIMESSVASIQKTDKNMLTNTTFYCPIQSRNLSGLVGAYQIVNITVYLSTISNNTSSPSAAQINIEYFNGSIRGGNPFISTIQLQSATATALQGLLNKTGIDTNDYTTTQGIVNTYTSSFNGVTTYVDSELFLGFGSEAPPMMM